MSEKKNIDRLFQEKFKDFEELPPDFVWDNIREKLEEKKKRRVIPLWFKLSGVAALLIMGLLLGGFYLNAIDTNDNPVVIDKGSGGGNPIPGTPVKPSLNASPDGYNDDINAKSGIVNSDGVNAGNESKSGNNQAGVDNSGNANAASATKSSSASVRNNAIVHSSDKGGKNENRLTVQPGNAVANTSSATNNKSGGINRKSEVASNNKASGKTNSGSTVNGVNQNADLTINGNASGKNKNNAIASQNNADAKTGKSSGTLGKAVDNAGSGVIDASVPLNEQAIAETVVDTVAAPENELEKLLREKQEGKKDDAEKAVAATDVKDKWSIKPQLAPVFYNSLSSGSPIDGQFAGNAKSYDNDLSVGLGVNYAITSRLKVRSGINTVNLNYATQDVQFYASLDGQTKNVAARSSNANIVVQDQKNNVVDPSLLFANNASDRYSGSMLQKTGYVEVPVEMSYALLNKKFGIDIIGGVSTLFLNQNNVSVVSEQGLSTNVGEAQNLNNIHFSTNVGLGFKYRFFKAFEANFEPMFKYQVNTFSRDAGNFKPYFIGLYSGISFSF
jgi:hypothetical protein